MPKVWNKHTDKGIPKDAIYVGRPTKWGNPYLIQNGVNRESVVEFYKLYLANKVRYGELDLKELKGKDLVCWCAPEACHADVLLELANKPTEKPVGEFCTIQATPVPATT